jgi:hypothetical protein
MVQITNTPRPCLISKIKCPNRPNNGRGGNRNKLRQTSLWGKTPTNTQVTVPPRRGPITLKLRVTPDEIFKGSQTDFWKFYSESESWVTPGKTLVRKDEHNKGKREVVEGKSRMRLKSWWCCTRSTGADKLWSGTSLLSLSACHPVWTPGECILKWYFWSVAWGIYFIAHCLWGMRVPVNF